MVNHDNYRNVKVNLGRFTCPDLLWEKYYSWTPYQYCQDNPIDGQDGNGYFKEKFGGNGDGKGDDLLYLKNQNYSNSKEVYLVTEMNDVKVSASLSPNNNNCIGFAFAGEGYFINPTETKTILMNDNYKQIKTVNVAVGDIVLFGKKDDSGQITYEHAGTVSKVIKDEVGNVTDVEYEWKDNLHPKATKTSVKSRVEETDLVPNESSYGELNVREYYRKEK